MKSHDSVPLSVKILGREYQVACPAAERDELLASARYLDDRMQAIRKRAAGLGLERIAVMAALNMARELHQRGGKLPSVPAAAGPAVAAKNDPAEDERIQQMNLRIDAELGAD